MLKTRRMRCPGHVACTRDRRNAYRILVELLERKEDTAREK
jgi:hypothetical protein